MPEVWYDAKGLIKRSCNLDILDAGHPECGVLMLFFLQIQ